MRSTRSTPGSQQNHPSNSTEPHTAGDRITGPADHQQHRPHLIMLFAGNRPRSPPEHPTGTSNAPGSTPPPTPCNYRRAPATSRTTSTPPPSPQHRGPEHRPTSPADHSPCRNRPRSSGQTQREHTEPSKKINTKGPRPPGHDHHQSIERAPATHPAAHHHPTPCNHRRPQATRKTTPATAPRPTPPGGRITGLPARLITLLAEIGHDLANHSESTPSRQRRSTTRDAPEAHHHPRHATTDGHRQPVEQHRHHHRAHTTGDRITGPPARLITLLAEIGHDLARHSESTPSRQRRATPRDRDHLATITTRASNGHQQRTRQRTTTHAMQPPTATGNQQNNIDTTTEPHTAGDRITGTPARLDHALCR